MMDWWVANSSWFVVALFFPWPFPFGGKKICLLLICFLRLSFKYSIFLRRRRRSTCIYIIHRKHGLNEETACIIFLPTTTTTDWQMLHTEKEGGFISGLF